MSDRSLAIAVASAEPSGPQRTSGDLKAVVREWTSKPREGSQWEGIATDATGRALVLEGTPGGGETRRTCS